IIPDGLTETTTAQSFAEVDAFVNKYNGERNIYFSVNPLKTPMFKKAAKTDVAAVEYLLGDLDPQDNEESEAAKQRYLNELKTFEPKTTAVIDSGNGVQILYRLDHAVDLSQYPVAETIEDGKHKLILGSDAAKVVADIEGRSKALMERLGSKAGTQNVDR